MRRSKDEENPEWTKETFRRARPARKVFPHLDFPKPRGRGRQKTPTKVQTTIRLDRDLVEHFKAEGRGWQTRINDALRRSVARAPMKSKKRA
jgi:uncharacterized protein (DUF4415 family)